MLKRLGFAFLGLLFMFTLIVGAVSATGVTYEPTLAQKTRDSESQYTVKIQEHFESVSTLLTGLLTSK